MAGGVTNHRDSGHPDGLRERKKDQTRRALHRAALELICERGPAATTIDDIVERAGVSRRTFFNYYSSREAALTSSNPQAQKDLLESIRQAPPGLPAAQILRTAARAWMGSATTDTELAILRRRAIEAWPDFATMVTMASTALGRQVLSALLAREDVTDCLETRILTMTCLDVARSVYLELASTGFSADLDALLNRGFATLGQFDLT